MMDDIPAPQVLDPQRVSRDDRADATVDDHRSRARLLGAALDETCGYAQQLWNELAAVRQYLHDTLPPAPGLAPARGATPTGPDDEQGWRYWIDAFATTTSTLCGPHGDAGYGRDSAAALARSRRQVVVPVVTEDPELSVELTRSVSPQTVLRTTQDEPSASSAAEPAPAREMPAEAQAPALRTTAGPAVLVMPLIYGAIGSVVTVVTVVALRGRARSSGGA